jgi:hypothetical protein
MRITAVSAVGVLVSLAVACPAIAQGPPVRGVLSGFNEVPAIVSTGYGAFFARINESAGTIDYELSYDGTEGSVTQSHIHVGQPGVNGAVSVFLCTNLGNGPAGTQPCPAAPGVISGTISANDVIGPAGQGVEAGAFADLVQAIRAGATYVNIHTTTFPGGEVRSRLGAHN